MTEQPAPEREDKYPLFDFLRLVAIAAARKKLTAREAAVAIFVAVDSGKGTTGRGASLDKSKIAKEFGISERHVEKLFYDRLVADGYFERTAKAVRGRSGVPGSGKRARYCVGFPAVDLGLKDDTSALSANPADQVPSDDTSALSANPTHQTASEPVWHDIFEVDGTSDSELWPVTVPAVSGSGTPSSGSPIDSSPSTHPSASTPDRASEDTEMDGRRIRFASRDAQKKAVGQ